MKLAVESKKNYAIVMCIHAQTHNHLEGFSGWKDEATVHNGLTVPSNSILVDNVVFYLILFYLFIYLFILFIYGLFYDAVSVADYVMPYGRMYGE